MRITKVYTRTGDKGTTALVDGSRVPKTHPRLASYGTVDELNSVLAMCRLSLAELKLETPIDLDSWLEALHNDLFNLGADLATPAQGRWQGMKLVTQEHVDALEKMIDMVQEELAPLAEFVLPGGDRACAELHLARTVCRRAERLTQAVAENDDINPSALPYLNRLSDLLFVLSRYVMVKAEQREVTWSKEKGVNALFNSK